ncbi:MAG: zinc ribbon domain-containing protein [Hydrogenophaga sp.]|nr:zinc ribbon domain-containing protein [Hydrogenophaga sp.]
MPIYAYKCASCGHAKDVLQKMSDAPLTACPACGAEAFSKQLTAAGFQLKGSGWYATDFRGGAGATAAPAAGAAAASTEAAAPAAATADSSGSGGSAAAGGCGTSCACH